jgi:mannose-6-phosphate isomerase-like protein (cupin superfamily)
VVTGHDASGKAVVLIDGAAPNIKVRQAQGGVVSTLLWVTDESPANIAGREDRAARDIGVAPPARGSVFRVVDFPPLADPAAISSAAVRAEMGLPDHGAARHPLMHRTRSIDYAVVLQGEIDMLLDDSQVHLKAGDLLVQQGTNHAWVNRGTEPCRIAFILIDSKEP